MTDTNETLTDTEDLLLEAFLDVDFLDFRNELERDWPEAVATVRLIGGDELLDEIDSAVYDAHQFVHTTGHSMVEATARIEDTTEDSITEAYGELTIAHSTFTAGEILRRLDPVVFEQAVQDELRYYEEELRGQWDDEVEAPLRSIITKHPALEVPLEAIISVFREDITDMVSSYGSKLELDEVFR